MGCTLSSVQPVFGPGMISASSPSISTDDALLSTLRLCSNSRGDRATFLGIKGEYSFLPLSLECLVFDISPSGRARMALALAMSSVLDLSPVILSESGPLMREPILPLRLSGSLAFL